MSWLPDGRFIADQTADGSITTSGADVPALAEKLHEVNGNKKEI